MDGAKIYNLGLSLIFRLNSYVGYLSFLGGEAQRPIPNNNCRTISATDTYKPFNSKSKLEPRLYEPISLNNLKEDIE